MLIGMFLKCVAFLLAATQFLPRGVSQAIGNCDLFDSSFVELEIPKSWITKAEGDTPVVIVEDMRFVCLSAGDLRSKYSYTSVLVNFTYNDVFATYQFEVACVEDMGISQWNTAQLDGYDVLVDPSPSLWNTEADTSCWRCIGGGSTTTQTHCAREFAVAVWKAQFLM